MDGFVTNKHEQLFMSLINLTTVCKAAKHASKANIAGNYRLPTRRKVGSYYMLQPEIKHLDSSIVSSVIKNTSYRTLLNCLTMCAFPASYPALSVYSYMGRLFHWADWSCLFCRLTIKKQSKVFPILSSDTASSALVPKS